MGERFLVLEETAAELDAIDPELGNRFRTTNGLPDPDLSSASRASLPSTTSAIPTDGHDIRMVVGDRDVRAECACGQWSTEVDWDRIDTMVFRIREHLGSEHATSGDGIPATAPSKLTRARRPAE